MAELPHDLCRNPCRSTAGCVPTVNACIGLAIMPTEMDVLVEGNTPEPPQPTVPPSVPSAESSRAATAAPLRAADATMATAAVTVTTAAAVASAKGAGEGIDISVEVLPPNPPRLRHPEVQCEPTGMDGLRLRPARP